MRCKQAYIGLAVAAAFALTACEDVRVEKYPNGNTRFETTYVKDKKEGLEKEYYQDGTLKRETTYKNDRREGLTKEYYEDGSVQSEIPYVDGYIEGDVVRYYKNGKVTLADKGNSDYKTLYFRIGITEPKILQKVTLQHTLPHPPMSFSSDTEDRAS